MYAAKDIPGENSFTSEKVVSWLSDVEEILCTKSVKFYGQPAAIIVADREKTATRAAKYVKIKYSFISTDKPLLNIPDVLVSSESSTRIRKEVVVNPVENGKDVDRVISGEFSAGAQYHFTMELQTCVVYPTEDGMDVYSSTQWLHHTTVAIANCLNILNSKYVWSISKNVECSLL